MTRKAMAVFQCRLFSGLPFSQTNPAYPNWCTTSYLAVKIVCQFKRTPESEDRSFAPKCQDVGLATPTNEGWLRADLCGLYP